MYIYYNNGIKVERQDILKELVGIRKLKKDEIDNIYNNALNKYKEESF